MIAARGGLRIVQVRIAALRLAVHAEIEDRNRLIYHILRGGVVVAVGVLLFGFLLAAMTGRPTPTESVPVGQLPPELARFTPAGYLSLGVLVLMLTPVARVLISLLSFVQERDSKYLLMTGIVLSNLILGLLVLG